VHRNDPCSCGSNKKYKKCCYLGPVAAQGIVRFFTKIGGRK
jgi:hypothetical protein